MREHYRPQKIDVVAGQVEVVVQTNPLADYRTITLIDQEDPVHFSIENYTEEFSFTARTDKDSEFEPLVDPVTLDTQVLRLMPGSSRSFIVKGILLYEIKITRLGTNPSKAYSIILKEYNS